jgi:hypothetical protein
MASRLIAKRDRWFCENQPDLLGVPGLMPDMGRSQDVMGAFDLNEGPGANESQMGFRILRRKYEYRNEIIQQPTARLIQHGLRYILYGNVNAQLIFLYG